jgi:hypothetical protein
MIILQRRRHPLTNLGNLPDVENKKLSNGFQGNIQTVEIMKKMAREGSRHPLVRRLATNIVHFYMKDPSHQYLNSARAIGDFVQKHVTYTKDTSGVETLHTPDMMIRMMEQVGYATGDCDDMALLIASLLLSIGINPSFRCVKYRKDSPSYNHIYVVAYESNVDDTLKAAKKERLVLDAIVKDRPIGFEVPHSGGDEFPV